MSKFPKKSGANRLHPSKFAAANGGANFQKYPISSFFLIGPNIFLRKKKSQKKFDHPNRKKKLVLKKK